jgi:hypothetical protein
MSFSMKTMQRVDTLPFGDGISIVLADLLHRLATSVNELKGTQRLNRRLQLCDSFAGAITPVASLRTERLQNRGVSLLPVKPADPIRIIMPYLETKISSVH